MATAAMRKLCLVNGYLALSAGIASRFLGPLSVSPTTVFDTCSPVPLVYVSLVSYVCTNRCATILLTEILHILWGTALKNNYTHTYACSVWNFFRLDSSLKFIRSSTYFGVSYHFYIHVKSCTISILATVQLSETSSLYT